MTNDPCSWSARDDVFEGYLRGALSATDREAFEEHYFVCPTCLARLRAYEGLRAELGAQPAEAPAARPGTVQAWLRSRTWRWALVPAAGGLAVLVAVALWVRSPAPAGPESTTARAPAAQPPAARPAAPQAGVAQAGPSPAAPQSPAGREGAPGAAQPSRPAGPAAKLPSAPAPPPVVALSVLARVEAPPYAPAVLRGPRDQAAAMFDAAMRQYVKGAYADAVPGLDAAASLRPDVPHYAFFLAVCRLLTDRVELAVAGLETTIAIGESPYLEEAHFYLAKARLRQGDIPAARDELRWTVERQGRLAIDARRLLAQVDALPSRR